MKKVLVIRASLFGDEGQSSRLVDEFLACWRDEAGDTQVVARDFSRDPIPHLDRHAFAAFLVPEAERSAAQREAAALSDQLLQEFLDADLVLVGAPMYNRSIPSQLKAYIDHIVRVGKTFRYTASGPVGLAGGRDVVILSARGGSYLGTPSDSHTLYLNDMLQFIGIDSDHVHWVLAEGLNISPDNRDRSMQEALVQVRDLVPKLAFRESIVSPDIAFRAASIVRHQNGELAKK